MRWPTTEGMGLAALALGAAFLLHAATARAAGPATTGATVGPAASGAAVQRPEVEAVFRPSIEDRLRELESRTRLLTVGLAVAGSQLEQAQDELRVARRQLADAEAAMAGGGAAAGPFRARPLGR